MIHSHLLERTIRIAGLCSLDPVTLTGLAIGAIAGGVGGALSGGGAGGNTAPTTPTPPPDPTAAAPPVQQPVGSQKSGSGGGGTPSFIGSAAAPSQVGYGQKSLLGQ